MCVAQNSGSYYLLVYGVNRESSMSLNYVLVVPVHAFDLFAISMVSTRGYLMELNANQALFKKKLQFQVQVEISEKLFLRFVVCETGAAMVANGSSSEEASCCQK